MAVCLKTAAYALLPLLLPVPLPGNMLCPASRTPLLSEAWTGTVQNSVEHVSRSLVFPFGPASEHPGANPLLWSSASPSVKSAPKVRLQGLEEDGNGRGWGKQSEGEVTLESSSVTRWENRVNHPSKPPAQRTPHPPRRCG